MTRENPVLEFIPPSGLLRRRLGDSLQEVELLRQLLRLAERTEAKRMEERHHRVSAARGCGLTDGDNLAEVEQVLEGQL